MAVAVGTKQRCWRMARQDSRASFDSVGSRKRKTRSDVQKPEIETKYAEIRAIFIFKQSIEKKFVSQKQEKENRI